MRTTRAAWLTAIAFGLVACDPGVFRTAKPQSADAGPHPQQSVDAGTGLGPKAGSSAGMSNTAGVTGTGGTSESVAGAAAIPGCSVASDLSAVHVSTRDLGTLTAADASSLVVGPAETIQDRTLWLFYESDAGPSTAAWSSAPDLTQMPLKLSDARAIAPLFAGAGSSGFIPTSVWIGNTPEVRFFFAKYPGLYPAAVGVASLTPDATSATILKAPGELFGGDPAADGGSAPTWFPFMFVGAVVADDFVYAYACQARPDAADEQLGATHQQPCRAARVATAQVLDGSAYRFWNGQAWVADFEQAVIVLDHMPSGLSVAYNRYLGKYLATHSGVDNNVVLRWADTPAGPFTDLASLGTLKATAGYGLTYSALEHVTWRQACDRVLYVSYILPLSSDDAGLRKETRLMRVELQ